MPRKLTLDDLWTFKEMGNVALSPDGRHVAFVMHGTDKAKNERQSAIWLLRLDEQGRVSGEGRPRCYQLTSGVKNDTYPVWAPDSKRLLFLSDREAEKNQLWLIDTSPDGQWIAFTAMTAPTDDDEVLTGRKSLEEAEKKKREEAERIRLRSTTRIWYRVDGRGFFEKFSQVFVMPAPRSGDSSTAPATIRRLTSGDFDHLQPAWTPDSREISVLCNRADDRDRSFVTDLWVIARETAEARRISNGTLEIATYAWSPDGSRVMLVAAQDLRIEGSCNTHLYLLLLPGEYGLVLAQERPLHPWEFYLLPVGPGGIGELMPLTHLYDSQLAEFVWSEPERMRYSGSNGDEIEGWLMRPVGARDGVRYPLLVDIHGGPQWAFGVGMDSLCQFLAAQGFAVFYCNPHGSSGYGQAFMREVEGDWGGWDFHDIMLGVDACIARGVADPERLVVTGYSYGGYMSMFTIGQTGRFKAAVPMAGISNLMSFVGTSDIGFWQAAQAKGYPWDPERQAYYRERSPLTYATRVTTPTLLLHPEDDLRCPIEQSEQFYMTLKVMGKAPVELVRAPAAWHSGTTKPGQWLAYWEKALEWFCKYVDIRPEEYD